MMEGQQINNNCASVESKWITHTNNDGSPKKLKKLVTVVLVATQWPESCVEKNNGRHAKRILKTIAYY